MKLEFQTKRQTHVMPCLPAQDALVFAGVIYINICLLLYTLLKETNIHTGTIQFLAAFTDTI